MTWFDGNASVVDDRLRRRGERRRRFLADDLVGMTRGDQTWLFVILGVAVAAIWVMAAIFYRAYDTAGSILWCEENVVLYYTQPWAEIGEETRPVYDLTPPCHLNGTGPETR